MKHHFPVSPMNQKIGLTSLHEGVKTLGVWTKRLDTLYHQKFETIKLLYGKDNVFQFKGDAFEHLVEALIEWRGTDTRINIMEYCPSEINKIGIDGEGKSTIDSAPHTVQCKYRTRKTKAKTTPLIFLETHDLSTFVMSSLYKYDGQQCRMTVFTTANDANHVFNQEYGERVKVIGYAALKHLVDNVEEFWNFYTRDFFRNVSQNAK